MLTINLLRWSLNPCCCVTPARIHRSIFVSFSKSLSLSFSLHSEQTLESFVRDESIEGSTRLALVAEMFDGLRFMHEFRSLFVFIALFSCLSVSNTYTHTRTHTHTHI